MQQGQMPGDDILPPEMPHHCGPGRAGEPCQFLRPPKGRRQRGHKERRMAPEAAPPSRSRGQRAASPASTGTTPQLMASSSTGAERHEASGAVMTAAVRSRSL